MLPLTLAVLLGASSPGAAQEPLKEQKEYLFAWDLGPAEVDVSSYPARQREAYGLFARTCSQCHTLARAINAPMVRRRDWRPYVEHMHLKGLGREAGFTREEALAVLDFLAFDSRERKSKRRREFDAEAAELSRLFEEVRRRRERPAGAPR